MSLFTGLHPVTRAIGLYGRVLAVITETARVTESSHQPSIRPLRRTQRPSAAMARTVSASRVGAPALGTAE
nr:hypothetical protein [uncultured Spirosoma sp.]